MYAEAPKQVIYTLAPKHLSTKQLETFEMVITFLVRGSFVGVCRDGGYPSTFFDGWCSISKERPSNNTLDIRSSCRLTVLALIAVQGNSSTRR
jgi:hypothetical protein